MERAATMEAAGNGKASLNSKALRNAEWSANTHRHLKNIFNDGPVGQINSILIKEGDEWWVRITDSERVQDILVTWNENHFNQAAETPLRDPVVMEQIGWTTKSEWCEAIL